MEVLEGVGAESRLYDAARLLSTLWVQVTALPGSCEFWLSLDGCYLTLSGWLLTSLSPSLTFREDTASLPLGCGALRTS